MKLRKRFLAIGSMDPLGAAGVAADQRAAEALGYHTMSVVSAVTAQNSDSFNTAQTVDAGVFEAQLKALTSPYQPDVIKIGMLYDPDHIKIVADALRGFKGPVVWDPVMGATKGPDLWSKATRSSYFEYLWPYISVITPNCLELPLLLMQAKDISPEAAFAALQKPLVLKGGHSPLKAEDRFISSSHNFTLAYRPRPFSCRGTGCVLATAIACYLGLGERLEDAVILAKVFLTEAMDHSDVLGSAHILRPQKRGVNLPLPTLTTKNWPLPATRPFPSIDEALGVYPIVSRANQLTELLATGITTAQIRIKDLPPEERLEEIRRAVDMANEFGCRLFVNDHWREAIQLGAYGVHLGHEDLFQADLEQIRAAGLRLGLSTHSYYEAQLAAQLQPSYLALGPIFKTTCKSMAFGPQGIMRAGEWVNGFAPLPIVAIGGLKLEHVGALKTQGVSGVAVISDILEAASPRQQATEWLSAWDSARCELSQGVSPLSE